MVGKGVPSSSRGAVRTTSTAPQPHRWAAACSPRIGRPSCAATSRESSALKTSSTRRPGWCAPVTARRARTEPRPASSTDVHRLPNHDPSVSATSRAAAPARVLGVLVGTTLVQDDVPDLAGHHVREALPGLGHHEGWVLPPLQLFGEVVDPLLALGDVGLERAEPALLLDQGTHEGRQRCGDRQQQHREDRRATRQPARRGAGSPAGPSARPSTRHLGRAGGACRTGSRSGRGLGAGSRPGSASRSPLGPTGPGRRGTAGSHDGAVSPGSRRRRTGGRHRRPRSAPRRRAPPRSAAAGCTWRPARTGPGHRS